MRRTVLIVAALALLSGSAHAISQGTGGTIYWDTVSGNISKFMLYKAQIDSNYTVISPAVNFENVTSVNAYTSWTRYQKFHAVEVLDPRIGGGQGNLVMTAISNNNMPSGGFVGNSWNQPWDILKINPNTATATTISNGSLANGNWDSKQWGPALVAPANWRPGTQSNGLSFAVSKGIWSNNTSVLYDQNNNGFIDNTTSEGMQYSVSSPNGQSISDSEFGGDKALYLSCGNTNVNPGITRSWMKSNGTLQTDTYLNCATILGKPIGKSVDGGGIAVNTRSISNPIVYFLGIDNGLTLSGTGHLAIFAARDLNGDNVITYGTDTLAEVWHQGLNGVSSYSDSVYGGEDLELYVHPDTGKSTLAFNDYQGGLYFIDLADNGLQATGTGKVLAANTINGNYAQGFEIDMNPVPEPATMFLLGTGALGAVSWLRRRRVM